MSDQQPGLDPSIIVIFGITGDLSRRYLLPALYHLCKDDLLPNPVAVIGTSRQTLELDDFLGHVELCVLEQDNICDPDVLKKLRKLVELVQLDPTEPTHYDRLLKRLNEIEDAHGECLNRLYYLSIPPQIYAPVINNLGSTELNGSCQHGTATTRLLVEKPFGYDLASAEALIKETSQRFKEEQLFRIDHYLAKEISQAILPFRLQNPAFEALWNAEHISKIEIIAIESLDVEGRKFYDQIGALRDLVQSHLLQLLALTTMELPATLEAADIHSAKQQLLESIAKPVLEQVREQVVRGQYEGYRQEVDNPTSTTETFVSLSLELPTSRWQGTSLELTTGKALAAKQTAVVLHFREGGKLSFQIQPEGAIALSAGRPKSGDWLWRRRNATKPH
jgi:glucose-6-phosphate 1-dehydrogenase